MSIKKASRFIELAWGSGLGFKEILRSTFRPLSERSKSLVLSYLYSLEVGSIGLELSCLYVGLEELSGFPDSSRWAGSEDVSGLSISIAMSYSSSTSVTLIY